MYELPQNSEKFKKIPEMLGFDGEYSAGHQKAKFWPISVKNRKMSAVKHFIEKPILLIKTLWTTKNNLLKNKTYI